jgi:hypothetical protein
LYTSPNIIRVIKSRRMRWAGHIARTGELRNAYNILVGKSEGKKPRSMELFSPRSMLFPKYVLLSNIIPLRYSWFLLKVLFLYRFPPEIGRPFEKSMDSPYSKKRPSRHIHKVPTRSKKVSPRTFQTALVVAPPS